MREMGKGRPTIGALKPDIKYVERFKAVVDAGTYVLKVAMLVNGGAMISLLTFIGNIWTKSDPGAGHLLLLKSISFFQIGLVCAVVAVGCNYLSLLAYNWDKYIIGDTMTVVTILATVFSFGLFLYGTGHVVDAFLAMAPNPS